MIYTYKPEKSKQIIVADGGHIGFNNSLKVPVQQHKEKEKEKRLLKRDKIIELYERGYIVEEIYNLMGDTTKGYISKVLSEYRKNYYKEPKMTKGERTREQILIRLDANIEIADIAKDLGISRQYVYQVKEEFYHQYRNSINPKFK